MVPVTLSRYVTMMQGVSEWCYIGAGINSGK